MQLIPRSQNVPVRRSGTDFSDVFDRWARDFFSSNIIPSGLGLSPWSEEGENFLPKIEVKESDKTYTVSAELPGMKEDDINVTLKENTLVIEGEKKSESKKEEKGFFRSEFQYGSFYRAIPLDTDVDSKNVDASYKYGLLTVTLNKLKESAERTHKIQIKH